MTGRSIAHAVALGLTLLASQAAMAGPWLHNAQGAHRSDIPRATWMGDGEFALAPLAFVRFCLNNRADCEAKGESGIVALDDIAWRELNDVNQMVNARIAPNYAEAGRLAWSVTTTYGDCNDYAVQKRHELLARGWPSAALSLSVVVTPFGEGHLVLSVRTDRGDVVLDNLRPRIVGWNSTGYHFIKRQSVRDPNFWVEVKGRGVRPDLEPVALRAPAEPSGTLESSLAPKFEPEGEWVGILAFAEFPASGE